MGQTSTIDGMLQSALTQLESLEGRAWQLPTNHENFRITNTHRYICSKAEDLNFSHTVSKHTLFCEGSIIGNKIQQRAADENTTILVTD